MKPFIHVALGIASLFSFGSTASAAFVEIGKAGDNFTSDVNSPGAFNVIIGNKRFTRNNVYILTRIIFVGPGATLTIEPGTIIRGVKSGATGSGIATEPGTLVVARDAKVVANATPDDPIVMTSIDDPNVIGGDSTIPASYVNSQGTTQIVVKQNYAPGGPTGSNGFAYNQQWGGLVILGNAYVANYNTGAGTPPTTDGNGDGLPDEPHTLVDPTNTNVGGFGRDIIEGLDPTTVPVAGLFGIYGNKNDGDNSGVYRFLSVRYGGFKIGAANELNGITSGGIGRGSVMEFCEAAFNVDDGFEFFGGTIDTRHLFVNYCQDDSFDMDEGFRGTHQFWSVVQANATVARSGYGNETTVGATFTDTQFDNYFEVDGAETNNNGALPYTNVKVYNLTLVGSGKADSEFNHVQDARVTISNAALTNTADLALLGQTALDPVGTITDVFNVDYYFDANILTTENRDFTDLVAPLTTSATESTTFVIGNGTAPPAFYAKNGLDLRLPAGSVARAEDGPLPPSGLVQVNYAGYMRDNLFLSGWSVVDYLEALPATNVARPAVSLGGTTNPVITFTSAGASVKYVIERSTDRRNWVPVNGAAPLSGSGTINFTDSSVTFGSGTPLFYRAYAL